MNRNSENPKPTSKGGPATDTATSNTDSDSISPNELTAGTLPDTKPAKASKADDENMLVNILLNVVIPTLILMKLSGENALGPTWGIVAALSFPIGYGIYHFKKSEKVNVFSVIGVISIFLTGGMSLLKLDPKYIAIKEAAIPALIGIATLISIKTRYPLVKVFLYNDKVLQIEQVDQALHEQGNYARFQRALVQSSFLLACAFFLSAFLNYFLAVYILKSPPGTEAYNNELGRMTALSYPVIVLPSMIVTMGAFYYIFKKIRQLTGLELEQIFRV